MIILGNAEPSMTRTREIRREDVDSYDLIEGIGEEKTNVVLLVPSASVMVALDIAKDRVNKISVYYECEPASSNVKVELMVIKDQQVQSGWSCLGSFWLGSSLVPVYSRIAE